eukprot:scaffold1598_cov259-Chaetoceros_neogracile.AAC.20
MPKKALDTNSSRSLASSLAASCYHLSSIMHASFIVHHRVSTNKSTTSNVSTDRTSTSFRYTPKKGSL